MDNLINVTAFFDNCGEFDVYTEINGPRHFKENQNVLDDGTMLPAAQSMGQSARLFQPQHHQLDAIHRQYPNATFVLNFRPVDAWIASVLKWSSKLEFEILNEFFFQNST